MTRSAAYSALVCSLADQAMECEWTSALAIPQLSAEDAELVAVEYPEEVEEETYETVRLITVRPYLSTEDFIFVGLKFATAMREAARRLVWLDVQDEIERREQDEANEYAEAHPESEESIRGVASQFRIR
jgi:Asp-tRNA(Asn)/Glu-tRNA(Gln) amidotransferase A subunit family amidase